jgi:hypothetical protein
MSNVDKLVQILIERTGYRPDEVEWKFNEGFVFGIDIILKTTGKRIMHTHASFAQTDDKEILAGAMLDWEEKTSKGDYDIVIDIDEGITDKNYLEHPDNKHVKEWVAMGMPGRMAKGRSASEKYAHRFDIKID